MIKSKTSNLRIRELWYNLVLAGGSCLLIGMNFVLRQEFPCDNCWYSIAMILAIYLYLGLAIFLSLWRANKYVVLSNLGYLRSFAYPLRTFMLITILNIAVHLSFTSWVYPSLRSELKAQYRHMLEQKVSNVAERQEKMAQFPWLFVVYFAQQILFYNTIIAIPSSILSILIFHRRLRYV